MNRSRDARPLLLEQLESRLTMAGGVLSEFVGKADRSHERADDPSRARNDNRPHDIRVLAHQDPRTTGRPPLSDNRLDGRETKLGGESRPVPAPTIPSMISTAETTPTVTMSFGSAQPQSQSPESSLPLPVINRSQSASEQNDAPTSTVNSEDRPGQSGELGTHISVSVAIGNAPGDSEQTARPTGTGPAGIELQRPLTPAPDAEASSELSPSQMEGVNSEGYRSSWAETLPLSRNSASIPGSLRGNHNWEISADSLLRLRELGAGGSSLPAGTQAFQQEAEAARGNQSHDEAGDGASSNGETSDREPASRKARLGVTGRAARSVDAVIATWYGAEGGLIELTQASEAIPGLVSCQATPEMIHVVLKATMGLDRRVELLASSDHETPSNATMRDQVIAAIAQEMAMPVEWIDTNPAHLSAATCSAAVAVAGVYAVIGRKRSVGMQRTEQID